LRGISRENVTSNISFRVRTFSVRNLAALRDRDIELTEWGSLTEK
jgi:hypothetical protein